MNLTALGFTDVSRLAASFVLLTSKEAADSRDKLHHGVRSLHLIADGEEADILTRDKPWKVAKSFLTRLRNEAAPLFGGVAPKIENASVRSVTPGGRIDWWADHGEETQALRQVHVGLVPSPGAWLYCGGEAIVLNVGTVMLVNTRALHSEINLGPTTMSKLVVDFLAPGGGD